MKRLLILLFAILPITCFAIPGKQEFKVTFDDGYSKYINDGNKIVILEFIKKNPLSNNETVSCFVGPIKNGYAKVGNNDIQFFATYAKVNNRIFNYSEKKTDLFPYFDVCGRKIN